MIKAIVQRDENTPVCTTVPTFVDESVEFLVDTSSLCDNKDLYTDLSRFHRTRTKGGEREPYLVDLKGVTYDVIRVRFYQKENKDFKKVILFVNEPEGNFYENNIISPITTLMVEIFAGTFFRAPKNHYFRDLRGLLIEKNKPAWLSAARNL